MLDKTKIYDVDFKYNTRTSKRKNVKIVFEDNMGYLVESLIKFDSQKNGIRWSLKRHFYRLIEVQIPMKLNVCENCPLRKISVVIRQYDI